MWDEDVGPPKNNAWSYSRQDRSPRARRQERAQWPETPARSPSRRSRNHGGRGGKGQNAKGVKGEGKSKSKKDQPSTTGGKGAGFPELPQPKAEAAWCPPAPPVAPPMPQPLPVQTAESAQVKALLAALKKASSDLPPEVQSAMRGMQQDDGRQLTKQLHAAVSQLGSAKKSLGDLTSARANLHQCWSAFLETAITRWQKYAEEFAQQDKDLASQIEKAKESVKTCKENFRALQKLEGATKEETEVISDEETEQPNLSKVDEHMTQMQASLVALKGNMEEELRVAKRQRTEALAEAPVDGSTASHCGQGGK